jgi:hypothetical protein
MANSKTEAQIEEKFMDELKHHLSGWHTKISEDFGEENFYNELSLLQSDPVYSKFGFAVPEYVLVRLMGRFSISIGRRLGEIYDKVPRFVTAARFNLKPNEVAPMFDGLQLDIGVPISSLSEEDKKYLLLVFDAYFPKSEIGNGIGIEIRYNFNPNDSARLRKDEHMALLLRDAGLFPIYLIFSEISPRDEAIARLKRAGWSFFVGKAADAFMNKLVGMDFSKILDRPKIQSEIRREIDSLMSEMRNSTAFKQGAKIK